MARRELAKDGLWALAAIGLVTVVSRMVTGLGATTGLTAATPWGFWIGWKLATIAMAGGGFTTAAIVYCFRRETFRPILRRAVLIAFLGYGSFIVSLIVDLGLPWRIYMPVIRWQHHSVMFEVAWCVMLYFTVLALEVSPTALEHRAFDRPVFQMLAKAVHRLTFPIVVAGIMLSTLHQSSLGSLFLLMPFRLHPLWYSPSLPLLFFVSSIALGLVVVIVEKFVTSYIYRRPLDLGVYQMLAKVSAGVLGIYALLRIGDLAVRGSLSHVFDGSWQSVLFLVELVPGAIMPALLLSQRQTRESPAGLGGSAALALVGVLVNRLSVGFLAHARPEGDYVPTWIEFAITVGILGGAGLVFMLFVERLDVTGPHDVDLRQPQDPYERPQFDVQTGVYCGDPVLRSYQRHSLSFVFAAALAIAALPQTGLHGYQVPRTLVLPARGGERLKIDGNRDEQFVVFDHEGHQKGMGRSKSCVKCHHLDLPEDDNSPCFACHSDMYLPASIFDHDLHVKRLGDPASCDKCHGPTRSEEGVKACQECHKAYKPGEEGEFEYVAASYVGAMHELCADCHREKAEELNKPRLGRCTTCHKPLPVR